MKYNYIVYVFIALVGSITTAVAAPQLSHAEKKSLFEKGTILTLQDIPEAGVAKTNFLGKDNDVKEQLFYFSRKENVVRVGAIGGTEGLSDLVNMKNFLACESLIPPATFDSKVTNSLFVWSFYDDYRVIHFDEKGEPKDLAPKTTYRWRSAVTADGERVIIARLDVVEEPGYEFKGMVVPAGHFKAKAGAIYVLASEIEPLEMSMLTEEEAAAPADSKKFFGIGYPQKVNLIAKQAVKKPTAKSRAGGRWEIRIVPGNRLPPNEQPINGSLDAPRAYRVWVPDRK